MKNKLLFSFLILFSTTVAKSQMHVGLDAGIGTDKTIIADLRIGYHSTQYLFEAHEILSFSDAKPCYFGARVGKIIRTGSNSFLMPVAGYYYSVFTNDQTTKLEGFCGDQSQINKLVPAIGIMFVSGKCSIEARQINNMYQVTIGLWNILKSKN